MDYYNQTGEGILTVFIRPRHPAPWQEDPTVVSPATTMSQRFTVSKSDGDRRPSDMQGEVNQLFEGDEPPTSSSSSAEGQAAAGTETVLVLKGKEILQPASSPCLLAVRYMLATLMLDCCSVTPHCLCVTWIPNNPRGTVWSVTEARTANPAVVLFLQQLWCYRCMHCSKILEDACSVRQKTKHLGT